MGMEPTPQALSAVLARFDDATRLYALAGDGSAFSALCVERWSGWDALGAGFALTIDALSTDAHLSLDDRQGSGMLGRRLTLWTRLADGTRMSRTGLVTAAARLGADGGLARYRLTLCPWVHLLAHARRTQLHQDQTVLQIVETVFARYAPLAAWRVGDEVGAFMAETRPRSHCCQYRESDWRFVTRLLAEAGLGFFVEDAPETPAGHRLVLFADSRQTPEEPTSAADGGVRFHRDAAPEASDTVQGFGAVQALGAGELTWLSHDYKPQRARGVHLPLAGANETVRLELYDDAGPYAFADTAEAERALRHAAEALEARHATWLGLGSVRSFRAGPWFALTQAPAQGGAPPPEALLVAVRHAGINNLPPALREHATAALGVADPDAQPDAALTLPPDLTEFLARTDAAALQTQRQTRAEAVGYANSFQAIARDRPWRPLLHDDTGARWNPTPTVHGAQTAIVVGPNGETTPSGSGEIYCDKLGRIRVKFHWQDADSPPCTAWLRVAQTWAGPGVGLQLLPRIGMEVAVVHLNQDADRPLVLGALYNGQGEGGVPPTPGGRSPALGAHARRGAERPATDGRAGRSEAGSVAPGTAAESSPKAVFTQASDQRASAQGNLAGGHSPAWHGMSADAAGHRNAAALSGVKSKEFGGAGYNQLVFDDSDAQLRVQLATTQAATQLNLGHLIHQADNYRGSFRGHGFELRSDAWGALRAPAGLWLTTAPLAGPATPAGDVTPALALLQQAVHLLATYSDAAGTHQTVRYAAHLGVRQPNQSQLIADAAPAKALLTSARTTVPGTAYADARAQAPQRQAGAGAERVPHSGDGILGLAAQAGLGIVAGQSLQWFAGETLTLASGQASNWAVAGNLRLHSGQAIGWLAGAAAPAPSSGAASPAPSRGGLGGDGVASTGLSLIAAQGPMRFEAQHDGLKLQAKHELKLASVSQALEAAAHKRIVLKTAGGASVTIEGGNITWACPGTITVHAGKKSFVGPAQLSREMNSWPETKFDERVRIVFPNQEPAKNYRYEYVRADGAKIKGITDSNGWADIQKSLGVENFDIRLLGPADDSSGEAE